MLLYKRLFIHTFKEKSFVYPERNACLPVALKIYVHIWILILIYSYKDTAHVHIT